MKLGTAMLFVAGALASTALAQTGPQPAPNAPQEAAPDPEAPLAAAEARKLAGELAGMLEEDYVFPDVAKRYAEGLRAKVAAGAYDGVGTAGAFAERVTADLRAIAPDNHLRVMLGQEGPGGPGPRRVVRRAPAGDAGARPSGEPRRVMMPRPQPIEKARWLAPGVAYIRFNMFPGSPEVVEAARKFMADHADAKTMIFDIRTHRGGGLAEMDAIFPYLFDKPTALVRMDTRASVEKRHGSPIAGVPSLREIPTDEDVVRREHHVVPGADKRLFDAKVYVLTSNFTGSAAEHFALSLKRTKRATLIGEATGGAGHYGGVRPLGDKFGVFIPVGRTFDPDTGKGWEAVGVAPDVEVPAEQALVEALVRSGVARAEAEKLSATVHPQGPMRRPVPRS
jgi:hypothetical protein